MRSIAHFFTSPITKEGKKTLKTRALVDLSLQVFTIFHRMNQNLQDIAPLMSRDMPKKLNAVTNLSEEKSKERRVTRPRHNPVLNFFFMLPSKFGLSSKMQSHQFDQQRKDKSKAPEEKLSKNQKRKNRKSLK
jgi:hypothetical protein